MASWVVIELDTSAPQVEFGEASGAEAGQFFTLPYTVDEPGVVRARVFPSEGSAVELTVESDRVEGLLPPSIVGGPATVRFDVEDEVGNATDYDFHFTIVSPVGPTIRPVQPSAPPRGTGAPRPLDEPELERVVRTRWRRPSSSTSITSSSTRSVRSTLRLQSRASIDRSSSVSSAWSRWSSSSSTRAGRYVEIAVRTSTSVSAGPRREGPEEEAILFGLW
jgi:hypothetical protein